MVSEKTGFRQLALSQETPILEKKTFKIFFFARFSQLINLSFEEK